jgi:hypothetical protein
MPLQRRASAGTPRRRLGSTAVGARKTGQTQPYFRSRTWLARVAAAENDVLHLVAAEALGALFAKHPCDRIGHVALTASVGADNRGDTLVEGELRPVGKRFKASYFKAFEAHSCPLIPDYVDLYT